jgi:hypothetical protein
VTTYSDNRATTVVVKVVPMEQLHLSGPSGVFRVSYGLGLDGGALKLRTSNPRLTEGPHIPVMFCTIVHSSAD